MQATPAFALKVLSRFAAAFLLLCAVFFIPAGTLDYWQAWLFMALLFTAVVLFLCYFINRDPQMIERRMRLKERVKAQKRLIGLSWVVFAAAMIVPGLDRRFGWSAVPVELVLAADALMLAGYALFFLVMKENSYASRIIEVEKGQKVVSTGPYAVVRHPMYVSALTIWLSMPIALGSWWGFLAFALTMPPIIIARILNEEEVLRKGLKGYMEYCRKVRWRLVPGVW